MCSASTFDCKFLEPLHEYIKHHISGGSLKQDAGSKQSQLYVYILKGLMTASPEHAEVWFALAKAH